MTPEEIGLVFNQLVERRALFSFVVPGRRRTEQEKEAVEILERQYGRTSDLEEFLATQGLMLSMQDAISLGVASGGRIYVAVRNPTHRAPGHLAGEKVLQELVDVRRAESLESSAIWATFFFLSLLYFLYTQDERPVEAVSAYKDSVVELEEFLDDTRRQIDKLRSTEMPTDAQQQRIHETLVSLSESTLEARARGFFAAMHRLGVLESIPGVEVRLAGKEPLYRQTLWSAVDIATNLRRHAGTLGMPVVAAVAAVTTPDGDITRNGDAPSMEA